MRKIWACTKIQLLQLMTGRKGIAIAVMLAIFSLYVFMPFYQLGALFHEKIPLAPSVWFLSFYRMLVLHGGLVMFLFSDVPATEGYAQLMIRRSGRRAYIYSQCLYIIIASLLYTLIPLLLSVILTLPVLSLQNDWGPLMKLLSNSIGQIAEQTQLVLSFSVDRTVLEMLTPWQALILAILFMWMTTMLLGSVMMFCRLLISRMSGIIVAGILVGLPIFAMFDGLITVGKWLTYISPVSWSYIGLLDWHRGGDWPSPEYAGFFLGITIALMMVGSVWKFQRGDLKELS